MLMIGANVLLNWNKILSEGIIDEYDGEDKLYQLMGYMDKKPFWVTGMQIKGSHRIDQDDFLTLNANLP